MAFSPDGTRLASGSFDQTIRIWDAASGVELGILKGHLGRINSVAFSSDGTRLASGSGDNTVKTWEVASGKELATFRGHSRGVTSVVFSPDGCRLASVSEDFGKSVEVKLWDAASGKEIAEKPSFALSSAYVNPDWKIQAVPDGWRIRFMPTDHLPPDLLSLERKGYLALVGREIIWKTNESLLTRRTFDLIHWRSDVLAQLAAIEAPADAMVLRLRLCGQGGLWRAVAGAARHLGAGHERQPSFG